MNIWYCGWFVRITISINHYNFAEITHILYNFCKIIGILCNFNKSTIISNMLKKLNEKINKRKRSTHTMIENEFRNGVTFRFRDIIRRWCVEINFCLHLKKCMLANQTNRYSGYSNQPVNVSSNFYIFV
jgi:hypothetical protein